MTDDSTFWEPPGWFWNLLEDSDRVLQILIERLELLPRDQLRAFQECFENAKGEINPLYRDDLGGTILDCSEDRGDDFAAWVVSLGHVFYGEVRNKPELIDQFLEIFRLHEDEGQHPELRWNSDVAHEEYRGYQSPGFIAYAVYEERFKKSLYDELEPG